MELLVLLALCIGLAAFAVGQAPSAAVPTVIVNNNTGTNGSSVGVGLLLVLLLLIVVALSGQSSAHESLPGTPTNPSTIERVIILDSAA